MTNKESLNKIWNFIETHYNEKDDYPKNLYDILEDIEQNLERLKQLEYVMLLIVDYGLIDVNKLEEFMYFDEVYAVKHGMNITINGLNGGD